ncbi:MAG: TIGR03790 family protein [Acidobacteriota bacterium]
MPAPIRAALVAALVASTCAWCQGPERVLLIANRNSAESGQIADYYAAKRKIPRQQVCILAASRKESITREEYEQTIRKPVEECLAKRKLTEQIFYLVTTLGVPLRIQGTGKLDSTAGSVDSELTLLYAHMRGQELGIAGPQRNPMYKQLDAPFSHRAFPIYLTTRLAAYDVAGVKAMIDRGFAARNRGTVYLDMRDGSDQTGESWLRDAHILLPQGRSELEQTTEAVYERHSAIGYASWGSNDRHHLRRKLGFSWLPGAIATEYVSSDGRTFQRPPEDWNLGQEFGGSKQSLTADLIADGATGASGHTDEPFLAYTPHPDLLFPAYLAGRNLAESFYISLPAIGWMNIVVGDPLMTLGPP